MTDGRRNIVIKDPLWSRILREVAIQGAREGKLFISQWIRRVCEKALGDEDQP